MKILILITAFLMCPFSFAQEHISKTQDEIAFNIGTFIPGQAIPGVKDQIRFWGFSYFHPSSIWDLEYEFLGGRGGGVTYYTFTAGGRFDFKLFDSVDIFINGGLALHHYKRRPFQDQNFSFKSQGGIYFGFGGLLSISDNVHFRGEFKYHNSPGRSLYIGVGPSFSF